MLVANSKDLSVWKRYVEKVEEVYEGEERQSMNVANLAFRAIMTCGEQEDLWFWLHEERGLQVMVDLINLFILTSNYYFILDCNCSFPGRVFRGL